MSTTPAVRAVLLTGVPGSGKSTAGRLLAQRLTAALLDLDTATEALTGVVADLVGISDLHDPHLASLTRTHRYETLTLLAEENLRLGLSVVLVAPFSTERRDGEARRQLFERLRGAGGAPSLVWLDLAPPEVLNRLRRRGAMRDAEKLADQASVLAWKSVPPVGDHLAVDAAQAPDAIIATVLAFLATHGADGG